MCSLLKCKTRNEGEKYPTTNRKQSGFAATYLPRSSLCNICLGPMVQTLGQPHPAEHPSAGGPSELGTTAAFPFSWVSELSPARWHNLQTDRHTPLPPITVSNTNPTRTKSKKDIDLGNGSKKLKTLCPYLRTVCSPAWSCFLHLSTQRNETSGKGGSISCCPQTTLRYYGFCCCLTLILRKSLVSCYDYW